MIQIAWLLFTVLTIIGALHLYWAFGGLWPGHDEKSLVRTAIGTTKYTSMPPKWLTALVSVCIFSAGLFPLMWSAQISYVIPQGMVWLGMWVLSAVFIGRGIAGYMPFFRKSNSAQPFADLNYRYFSPLCLLIGSGFVALIYLAGV